MYKKTYVETKTDLVEDFFSLWGQLPQIVEVPGVMKELPPRPTVTTEKVVKRKGKKAVKKPKKNVDWVALADEVAKKTHGIYEVIPEISGVIDGPVTVIDKKGDEWLYISREKDNSPVPKEADREVEALKKVIPLLQEIIGHNLTEEAEKERRIKERKENLERCKKEVAQGLVKTLVVGGKIALAFGSLVGTGALILADPRLVVVLPDGTALCVSDWDS